MKSEPATLKQSPSKSFCWPNYGTMQVRWLALCVAISAVALSLAEATPGWAREAINWVSVGQNGKLSWQR